MRSASSKPRARGRPLGALLRYNYPYRHEYLGGALLALFFIATELTMPLVIRAIVQRFESSSMTATFLWAYFSVLIAIAVVGGVARYFQRSLMIGASRKFEYDLRNDYYDHLLGLSQDFFHRNRTGDIMARATNDMNYVRMLIGPGIMGTVDMIRVPFTLAAMLYLSTRLTLIAFVPLPLVSLLVYAFVMYMHHQSRRVQEQFSRVTARAQENLAGARVVQAYGIADRETRDFLAESEKYRRESVKLNVVMALAHPMIGLVIGGATLFVLWKGGGMVIDGRLSLGDFAGFMVYLIMLTWPLAQFGWVLTLYQRGAVSMNRILEVLTEVPTIRDRPPLREDRIRLDGAVRFRDVSLVYDGPAVLSGVDFDVPAGGTVAIVGPTGSGKSSIVALLTREYAPTAGQIALDGVDIAEIPLRVLRANIGYVPQDTFLFSASIRDNLTLGRPEATADEIAAACEVAQFTETLEQMPNGLDTLLGERGVNLSGGQKQRLAIARAVIRDPAILVLDDALSSVDTHTEELILQRLQEVMRARTSFLISHRVSTVRHADLILVVDDGRIAEHGTHAELLAAGGLYAAMYERQRLEQELEEA